MKKSYITKSRYLDGLQCPKLLWHRFNAREVIPPFDAATLVRFDQGRDVERYAHQLFPDGIAVEGTNQIEKIAERTQPLLAERKPLFEPGFIYNDVYARADILNPVEGGKWDIIEIKSAASVKNVNCHDVALQRFCYKGAGVPISRCYVMYINNQYVRHGPIEPKKLLCRSDITETVDRYTEGIEGRLEEMRRIIGLEGCPKVKIGPQCTSPHGCPMVPVCWAFLPERNVATFYGMKKSRVFSLIDRGINLIEEVPTEVDLSHRQLIQRECCKSGNPHVNVPGIRDFLNELKFPLYFLDFETLSSAIPYYDNTKPFDNIPFQYSLHVWDSPDTEPVHHAHLAAGDIDPRSEVLSKLKAFMGKSGSIVCYSVPFEKARLKECTTEIPGYEKWFISLEKRFIDLHAPFKAFYYYHPGQDGSASIKEILPALTDKSYEDMEIGDGRAAANEYARVTFSDVPADERQRVRNALEKYCELDTLGMVDIVKALMALTK